MIYEKATAEVILFDNSDVIRTSGCESGSHNNCKNRPYSSSTCGNSNFENLGTVVENRENRFMRTLG